MKGKRSRKLYIILILCWCKESNFIKYMLMLFLIRVKNEYVLIINMKINKWMIFKIICWLVF